MACRGNGVLFLLDVRGQANGDVALRRVLVGVCGRLVVDAGGTSSLQTAVCAGRRACDSGRDGECLAVLHLVEELWTSALSQVYG